MPNTQTQTHLLTCDEMADLGMAVPEILENLEDSLGPQAVWKLTGLLGGRIAYIPHDHGLARSIVTELIGDQIVKWLLNTYGPGPLQIPLGPHTSRAKKMAAFRAAFINCQTHRKIAEFVGCHVRTVERAKQQLMTAGFL